MPLLCRLTGVFVVCCCLVTVNAAEIHVPGDYPTIQEAIDHAITGDAVLVAPGTYFENINFMGKEIVLKGIRGPEHTTLDGMQAGSVVTFNNKEDNNSSIKGFTITNGTGTQDGYSSVKGGGIYCNKSSPKIIGCRIINNKAERGGGIGCVDSSIGPTIINCYFITNNALPINNNAGMGGGIYLQDSDVIILSCVFDNNYSKDFGGAICGYLYSNSYNVLIKDSFFNSNYSSLSGGAIMFYNGIYPNIRNNIFINNISTNGGAVNMYDGILDMNIIDGNIAKTPSTEFYFGYGGGIVCTGMNPVISNNIITNNHAMSQGGGIVYAGYYGILINNRISYNIAEGSNIPQEPIFGGGIALPYNNSGGNTMMQNNIVNNNYCEGKGGGVYIGDLMSSGSNLTMMNCTVTNNKAIYGDGIFCESLAELKVTNSILLDEVMYVNNQPDISFSDVKGGFPGQLNIDTDPLFVDPATNDYHLQFLSPCRDAGDNSVADLPDTDFEGDPRIAYGTVDMGADEFHPHLYYSGQANPSSEISIKTIGLPRTDPLAIFLGKGSLETPLPSTYGYWYLDFPVSLIKYGFNIPITGVYSFSTRIPTAPLDTYYLQALIGDELSNLCVVEVE